MEQERPRVDVKRENCPYCKDAIVPGGENIACKECLAWHHEECWTEHGACSGCGGKLFSGTPSLRSTEKVPTKEHLKKGRKKLEAGPKLAILLGLALIIAGGLRVSLGKTPSGFVLIALGLVHLTLAGWHAWPKK